MGESKWFRKNEEGQFVELVSLDEVNDQIAIGRPVFSVPDDQQEEAAPLREWPDGWGTVVGTTVDDPLRGTVFDRRDRK